MKSRLIKLLSLVMSILLVVAVLPGCSGSDETADAEDVSVSEEETADGENLGVDPNTGEPIEAVDISGLGGNGADVDISKLSSTMVYSVVYDMMTRPNEYDGKKIRISGTIDSYHDEETDKTYYACLIADATACCSQGIEFQTTEDFKPSDYPKDGDPVTVLGTFDEYSDGDYKYYVLKNAILE